MPPADGGGPSGDGGGPSGDGGEGAVLGFTVPAARTNLPHDGLSQ